MNIFTVSIVVTAVLVVLSQLPWDYILSKDEEEFKARLEKKRQQRQEKRNKNE